MCNICSYAGDNLECYKNNIPYNTYNTITEQVNIVKQGKDRVHNKYLAINTLHANTYEFRIFNSTVDKDRILAYIEFVDALLEYCSISNYLQIYKFNFWNLAEYAKGENKYKHLMHRFYTIKNEIY